MLFVKICDALEFAHSKKVLHRDIKPKNILVEDDFDWEDDQPLRIPMNETIIYEVHVAGFTRQLPDLPANNIIGEPVGRGTAAARRGPVSS